MRLLWIIPVSIALACAGAYAVGAAMHVNVHVPEMLVAAGACLVASELAMVPLILTSGAKQPGVAQAGLIGTVIHLFACAVFAAGLIVLKPMRLDGAVVYWLLGLYWLTLMVLASGFVKILKAAPVGSA